MFKIQRKLLSAETGKKNSSKTAVVFVCEKKPKIISYRYLNVFFLFLFLLTRILVYCIFYTVNSRALMCAKFSICFSIHFFLYRKRCVFYRTAI